MDAGLAGRAALAGDAPAGRLDAMSAWFLKKFKFAVKLNEMNLLFRNVPVVASFLTSAVFAFVEDLDDT